MRKKTKIVSEKSKEIDSYSTAGHIQNDLEHVVTKTTLALRFDPLLKRA